jgi:hypothetical protein
MKRALASLLLAGALPAAAQDLHLQGFLEARLASSQGDERSWTDGGLGRTRFGEGGRNAVPAGALSLSWQASPSWLAVLDLQAQPQTSPQLGVLSAYLRWRPVSLSAWRWSVRAGAFFPPVSLENDGIGWTSRYTLTPSAINSWVGEELRDLGVDARVERRMARGTLEFGVAAFGWNDPAGELIATRGWALGDMTSPLGARVREPDRYGLLVGESPPVGYRPFVENDHRVGWHADLGWRAAGGARLALMRYDNRADPHTESHQAGRDVYSWRTRFWSAGAELPVGGVVLLAQWMDGSTVIEPDPGFVIASPFRAAFLLAAWDRGAWRPALRYDRFRMRQDPDFGMDEDGHAWTAAINWRPRDWLRLTAEWLRVDTSSGQRVVYGLAPRQVDRLVQFNLRYQF